MKKTTLTLTEDVHQRLASIADRRGWTLDQMLQDLIDGALQQDSARQRFVQINPMIESQFELQAGIQAGAHSGVQPDRLRESPALCAMSRADLDLAGE